MYTSQNTTCNISGKQIILVTIMDNTSQKTILIIEDDAAQREPLAKILTANGYNVIQAVDGKPGMEKATQYHPDLIVLDLIMPEMDGVAFLHLLRNEPWGVNIPVIIFTNVNPDTENTVKMVEELKPAYYIVKGELPNEEIVKRIKEVLEAQ